MSKIILFVMHCVVCVQITVCVCVCVRACVRACVFYYVVCVCVYALLVNKSYVIM